MRIGYYINNFYYVHNKKFIMLLAVNGIYYIMGCCSPSHRAPYPPMMLCLAVLWQVGRQLPGASLLGSGGPLQGVSLLSVCLYEKAECVFRSSTNVAFIHLHTLYIYTLSIYTSVCEGVYSHVSVIKTVIKKEVRKGWWGRSRSRRLRKPWWAQKNESAWWWKESGFAMKAQSPHSSPGRPLHLLSGDETA